MNILENDLNWVAGFLEGEGYFSKGRSSISVQASQVQLEPLERLQKIVGAGSILFYKRNKLGQNDYYRWGVHGMTAEALMKLLLPLMSPKRQKCMIESLSFYATLPGPNFIKNGRTTCVKGGHPWIKENIFIDHRGKNYCHLCKMERQRIVRASKGFVRKYTNNVIREAEQLVKSS
jgi:hypothetical protein